MSKLIGVPSNHKDNNEFTNYIPVNLTEYSAEEIKSHFNKWVSKKIDPKYETVTLLKPNSIIVELYRYEKINDKFLGINGEPLKKSLILPICKVLKSNVTPMATIDPNNYAPGTLLYCSDDIAKIETNPTWLQWYKIMKNERPQPEGLSEPDQEVGLILEWRKTSKFVIDKFNTKDNDQFVFLRTVNDFSAVYDYKA